MLFACANASERVDEYTYCTCVISPPLIDKNQNFFTLTMKKLKKYIKIVYIRIFEGTGLKKKIKAITNQEGFSYLFHMTGNSVKVC